jgi:hypothetical protein
MKTWRFLIFPLALALLLQVEALFGAAAIRHIQPIPHPPSRSQSGALLMFRFLGLVDSCLDFDRYWVACGDTLFILQQLSGEHTLLAKAEQSQWLKGAGPEQLSRISQNCHSFALQLYFAHHGASLEMLFNAQTRLTDKAMAIVLQCAFTELLQVERHQMHSAPNVFPDGSLIVLVDEEDTPVHSLFYFSGAYFTKHGALEPQVVFDLEPVFEDYPQVWRVEVYVLKDDLPLTE